MLFSALIFPLSLLLQLALGVTQKALGGQIPLFVLPSTGKLQTKPSTLAHPAIVLSAADANGDFTLGVTSHGFPKGQSTPVSSFVAQEDLGKVLTLQKGVPTPFEGTATNPTSVFTGTANGKPILGNLNILKQFDVAPGSSQSSFGLDSVNKFRAAFKGLEPLKSLTEDDDTTDKADPDSDKPTTGTSGGSSTGTTGAESKGIIGDAETAAKNAAGDVEGAVKGESGSLGDDAADVAETVGKGLLKDLRL